MLCLNLRAQNWDIEVKFMYLTGSWKNWSQSAGCKILRKKAYPIPKRLNCSKQRGAYSKERKKKLSKEQINEIKIKMADRNTSATALAQEYKISRCLLYKVLKS